MLRRCQNGLLLSAFVPSKSLLGLKKKNNGLVGGKTDGNKPAVKYTKAAFEGERPYRLIHHYFHIFRESKMLLIAPLTLAAPTLSWQFAFIPVLSWTSLAVYYFFSINLLRYMCSAPANPVVKDLNGKTAVVVGGTGDMGSEVAKSLLSMGANVVVISRNAETEDGQKKLLSKLPKLQEGETRENLSFMKLDLTNYVQVRDFPGRFTAKHGDKIDIMCNCAGLLQVNFEKTKFDDDIHLATNVIGPFLLVEGLLGHLIQVRGRFVALSTSSHCTVWGDVVEKYLQERTKEKYYRSEEVYGASKLGVIYHAHALAIHAESERVMRGAKQINKSLKKEHSCAFEVALAQPGATLTDLYTNHPRGWLMRRLKYVLNLVFRTPKEGSEVIVNCCVRDDIINGMSYYNNKLAPDGISSTAWDPKRRKSFNQWVKKRLEPFVSSRAPEAKRKLK